MSGPRGADPHDARGGFTLLEVLVVVLLAGLAAALAAPRFTRREEGPVVAAQRIAAELERARARAVAGARIETVDPAALAGSLPAGLRLVPKVDRPWRFFPDGSATPAALVVEGPSGRVSLRVEPLTGRIVTGDD